MKREVVSTEGAPKAIGPYSQAIAARFGGIGGSPGPDRLVFCSGQVGLDPATGELAEGLAKQVTRGLDNLQAVLKEAGLSPANVVKTTVFLTSMDDFAAMNELYAKVFVDEPPARSTVAVKELPKGAIFEIEAIAIKGH